MANYRFKQSEIEQMKHSIEIHCKNEREGDQNGNKSAWRLRFCIEGEMMCCRPSKQERARLERELALYEMLTKNDMPNFK